MASVTIRPIVAEEASAFLRLLCGVFELDFGRAEPVFFNEPMFDLGRKWALFVDGEMTSILTTTPMTFGWGQAVGIAGVATQPSQRGRGYARRLLEHVLERAEADGEGGALLFAQDLTVYRHVGFEPMDEVVRGLISDTDPGAAASPLDMVAMQTMYDDWAAEDPSRLRRDAVRWKFWQWGLRSPERFGSGYLCLEGGLVRECIPGPGPWPVPAGTQWLGLGGLTAELGVPLVKANVELTLMARQVPLAPRMFMTDQF